MIWPTLSYNEAKDTYTTLHLWTQIVGKIKLTCMPWINHSWHVTLAVTTTGLSTSLLPYKNGFFQVDFDFRQHQLMVTTDSGATETIALESISVARFYQLLMAALEKLGVMVTINKMPNEWVDPIPFDKDEVHHTYVSRHASDFHQALLLADRVMTRFRSSFCGKCSPVHFFWGSFDLAVTRFSGRPAPKHPGGIPHLPDAVAQEAYSQEVSSCGFWPGNDNLPYAAFYAYSYPEPASFPVASVAPGEAFYYPQMGEFILPYAVVQQADNPEETLLQFFKTTYEAAAIGANWDREALEFHFS